MTTEQDAAVVEATGAETVTFQWDEDEWTVPAWDELTGDQESAVRKWAAATESLNDPALCLQFLEQLLGPNQFAALNLSGSSKSSEIKITAAEIGEAMTEAWGLGKGWNRQQRRSLRSTKR